MGDDWFKISDQRQKHLCSDRAKMTSLMPSWTNKRGMQLQADTDVTHLRSLNPNSSAMPAIIQQNQGYCNYIPPAATGSSLSASRDDERVPAKSPNLRTQYPREWCQGVAQSRQQQLSQDHNHLNTPGLAAHMQGGISAASSSHNCMQSATSIRSSCLQPQNHTIASTSERNLEYSLSMGSIPKVSQVSSSIDGSNTGSGHGSKYHEQAATNGLLSKDGISLLAGAPASADSHKHDAKSSRISKVCNANCNEFMHSRVTNPTSMGCPPLAHDDTFSITSSKLSMSSWLASAGRQDLSPEEKEMLYRAAAMQPIGDVNSMRSSGSEDTDADKPKPRRNVRISKDPQSVAARHRRQRISSKMRVLQRLVPGGMKMDTASMLEEAAHYMKFLKAEVDKMEAFEQLMNVAKGQAAQMQVPGSSNQAISKTTQALPHSGTVNTGAGAVGGPQPNLLCNYPPSLQQLPQNYLQRASLSF